MSKLKSIVKEQAQLDRLRRVGKALVDSDLALVELKKKLSPMELEQIENEIARLCKDVTHG